MTTFGVHVIRLQVFQPRYLQNFLNAYFKNAAVGQSLAALSGQSLGIGP